MPRSLETLNTLGTPLSGEQLETVDGGILPAIAIAFLLGFNGVVWGEILTN